MNAQTSSSSHAQQHTNLDLTGTKSPQIIDQTLLDPEGVEVKDSITLLDLMTNEPQPELEKITLEARLAKKDKQLEAARKELCKIEGEKTKLKQEVVSTQRESN
jgi:hypothetical protein